MKNRLIPLAVCAVVLAPFAAGAEPKSDAVRKLEDQVRRAADRIDELLQTQKADREDNARLREQLEQARQELAAEKKAAEKLAAADKTLEALKQDVAAIKDQHKKDMEQVAAMLEQAKIDSAKAIARKTTELNAEKKRADALEAARADTLRALQTEKKRADALAAAHADAQKALEAEKERTDELAVLRAKTEKALELAVIDLKKSAEEKHQALLAAEQERLRAEVARKEAEAQRLLTEKNFLSARATLAKVMKEAESLKKAEDERLRFMAIAAAEQKLLKDRGKQLEQRIAELEGKLEQTRITALKFEGKVTAISSGLVKLNIGSDAGLKTGQEVFVYRTKPTPAFVGKLTIVDVTAGQSVAKPIGIKAEAIKEGDQVATNDVSK